MSQTDKNDSKEQNNKMSQTDSQDNKEPTKLETTISMIKFEQWLHGAVRAKTLRREKGK